MRVRFVDVVVVGESGCDNFSLLEACVILRLSVFCCVSSGKLSLVASMSSVLLFERLRVVLCVVCRWWFVRVVVRLICGKFWSDVLTEGEHRIIGSSRVVGWGCDIGGAWVLAATSFGSRGVAALSSGAFCLVTFAIP